MTSSSPIFFIATDFVPKLGGIAQFMFDLMGCLPSKQIGAIALPTAGWVAFDAQQPFAIQRLSIPTGWATDSRRVKFLGPLFYWQLRRHLPLSMVVCGHGNHALMLAAWLMKRWHGVPYGVFLHGYDIFRAQKRRYRTYYNRLLWEADVVFANGSATAQVAQAVGVPSEKIEVIHPCVTPAALQPSGKTAVLPAVGQGKRCLLTVARLVPRKGVDTVLKAMPHILAAVPDAHYVVVGDGPAMADLQTLADRLGLTSQVTFVGAQPHEVIADYFLQCDLFVMVTRELAAGDIESFGIVYLEANLLGKPVVAGRAGGVADAVLHEKTGLLVEPTQPKAVATAVIRLLQDRALAQQLAQNGRERVLQEFTSEAAARKFLNRVASLGVTIE